MHQSGVMLWSPPGWARLAGLSALLTTVVAVLVNIATSKWNPYVVVALVIASLAFAVLEILRARANVNEALAAKGEAESVAKNAIEIATDATSRLMVAVDDILNPLLVLMDR